MAKPDLAVTLGIKKKPKPSEGPPPDPNMAPDDESDPQDAVDDQISNDDATGAPGGDMGGGMGGDLTPMMLDYHGGDQACGNCSMFTAPATCSRWPDPVEEAGWCKGWQPQAQEQPNLGPMPGAQAGGPPPGLGGPPGAP